jgi:Holliday junction resolvasome RuvABC endonuclease subunit
MSAAQKVLGVDPSLTATGLAIIETDGVPGRERVLATTCIETRPRDEDGRAQGDGERQHIIAAAVAAFTDEHKPDIAGLEKTYMDPLKAANVTGRLEYLRGRIAGVLHERGVLVVDVAPASRAKALGVNGRGVKRAAQKAQVAASVKLRYGLDVGPLGITIDEADAIGVALAAAVKHGREAREGQQLELGIKRGRAQARKHRRRGP